MGEHPKREEGQDFFRWFGVFLGDEDGEPEDDQDMHGTGHDQGFAQGFA